MAPPQLKGDSIVQKTAKKKLKQPKSDINQITIENYKIISFARDTTFLDTTLTIDKEYKYNYLRKDDFELMPFANVGQPYNQLGLELNRTNLYPKLGARAKHFNYREIEDINYYNVATPMSDLMFKTTFEQGQMLDAMLAFNTSKRLNFSIGYKSLRSLGKYQFNQAESGNFTTTTNYVTKNGRYQLRAHITAQDVETEENGGLPNRDQFELKNEDFVNRVRVDVRFRDATHKILGKRYFLEHGYKLIKKQKDSSSVEKTSLTIGHQFNYETKYSQFKQDQPNAFFGNSLINEIDDKMSLKIMYNEFSANFYNTTLGSLQANISLYDYNYFTNSILITEAQTIDNQLRGQEVALGATYRKQLGGFLIDGSAKYNLSGELTGNIFDATASYEPNKNNKISLGIHTSSRMPNFNFLMYQSDYFNYNWQNNTGFDKEQRSSLLFDVQSKKWGALSANYTTMSNYTYFKVDPTIEMIEGSDQYAIKPFQESNAVNYLKLKYNKEIKVGGFALNNTLMYQNVNQGNAVLNVPEWVTRNTLYFSTDAFKKAMYLQTGVTLKYFSAYNMNAYNPALGEFFVQNDEKFGAFPLLDFFINARIQQTRLFLKAEHFNSSFINPKKYYAAPNYPYRDFVIRFGLVWNFFS
jgi:hypothetical protein